MIISNQRNFYLKNDYKAEDSLPLGIYELCFDEAQRTFFLEYKSESFDLPKKLYGDMSFIDDYLTKFENQSQNLGILFSGYRGTSKSVTCKYLCNRSKMPVILINQPYAGPAFTSFIADPIFRNSIILLDEYEKTYNTHEVPDTDILRLMDGVYNTKMLFLLTVNQTSYINENLFNRPSRVRYRRHYDSMDLSLFNELIDDKLVNKEFKQELVDVLDRIDTMTIDILTSVIEDINFFNRPPKEVVKMFNIVKDDQLKFTMSVESKTCDRVHFNSNVRFDHDDELTVYYYHPVEDDEDDESAKNKTPRIRQNYKYVDAEKFKKIHGAYVYEDEDLKATLVRSMTTNMIF